MYSFSYARACIHYSMSFLTPQLKLLLDETQRHLDVAQREAQAQREELSLVSGAT